jgi:hypothetical protein
MDWRLREWRLVSIHSASSLERPTHLFSRRAIVQNTQRCRGHRLPYPTTKLDTQSTWRLARTSKITMRAVPLQLHFIQQRHGQKFLQIFLWSLDTLNSNL